MRPWSPRSRTARSELHNPKRAAIVAPPPWPPSEEALRAAQREEDENSRLVALAIIHHAMGHESEAHAALDALVGSHAKTMAYQIAEVYGRRSDVNAAFHWLERAYSQRDGGIAGVKASRALRSLHGDPRWRPFLKKVGYADQ